MSGVDMPEEEEDRNTKKTINEVEALKGVFYSFFSDQRQQSSDSSDQFLVKMQVDDTYLNPFCFHQEKFQAYQSSPDIGYFEGKKRSLYEIKEEGSATISMDDSNVLSPLKPYDCIDTERVNYNADLMDSHINKEAKRKSVTHVWLNQIEWRLRTDWI